MWYVRVKVGNGIPRWYSQKRWRKDPKLQAGKIIRKYRKGHGSSEPVAVAEAAKS